MIADDLFGLFADILIAIAAFSLAIIAAFLAGHSIAAAVGKLRRWRKPQDVAAEWAVIQRDVEEKLRGDK